MDWSMTPPSPQDNFDCYATQILQILLWQCKEDLSTPKKTDNLANLCFSLCIHCHRLPPPFCSAHSPECSLTRTRLHKIGLLRQKKMPMSIRERCSLFYSTVMCGLGTGAQCFWVTRLFSLGHSQMQRDFAS